MCVDYFDFKKGTWSKMGNIPCQDFTRAAVTVMDGKVHILNFFGVYVYDPPTDKWNPATKSGLPRPLSGVVNLRNYSDATGGGAIGDVIDKVILINPKTGKFSATALMKSERFGHGLAVVKDLLYAVSDYIIIFYHTIFNTHLRSSYV